MIKKLKVFFCTCLLAYQISHLVQPSAGVSKSEETVTMRRKSAVTIVKGSTQAHRVAEVGRDLIWSNPLLQQGHLQLEAQDYVILFHTMLCCKNHTFSFVILSFLQSER